MELGGQHNLEVFELGDARRFNKPVSTPETIMDKPRHVFKRTNRRSGLMQGLWISAMKIHATQASGSRQRRGIGRLIF